MDASYLTMLVLVTLPFAGCRKFKVRRENPADGWAMLHPRKFISVFGVKIIAHPTVCNANLQYAANILAQMLDGNEDGVPDDKAVSTQLRKNQSNLLLFSSEAKILPRDKASSNSKILVLKMCKKSLNRGKTILAVARLIASYGLSQAYPSTLGDQRHSFLRGSLDVMVGNCGYAHDKTLRWPDCTGHVFYNDSACDAQCMAIEYLAQLMTISLSAIKYTTSESRRFWDVQSRHDLMDKDPLGFKMMNRVQNSLPEKAPDGNYRPGKNGYRMTCLSFPRHKRNNIKRKTIRVVF